MWPFIVITWRLSLHKRAIVRVNLTIESRILTDTDIIRKDIHLSTPMSAKWHGSCTLAVVFLCQIWSQMVQLELSVTFNKAAKQEVCPLPWVEELLAILTRGKCFAKLELAHAYTQIPSDESSKQYVTISIHKGLFTYNRFPFRVSAAPSIF